MPNGPTNMASALSKLFSALMREPAKAPDGLTDEEAAAPNKQTPQTSVLHDVAHLRGKNALYMADLIKNILAGEPMDDRKYVLEHGVALLQNLPTNSGLSAKLSDGFIVGLWKDLPHPPKMYIGPQDKYRAADGSGNNPHLPELGKSGTPYSRSVAPMQPRGHDLPDPELVFEMLLRREGFKKHPSGLNRLFFSFATIVIHELFQSNREKPWINNTTSYVDLSTLYGNNEDEQSTVRTYENGLIWPDVIASDRIMMMPPGVIAVLLMFSRHHNFIARRLLDINESGKYVKNLDTLSERQRREQDEDIFQLSRNINVGFFASVVLRDYVSAILNTIRANSTWHLDIGKDIKSLGGDRVDRGTGNSISCEFLSLYVWHMTLSAADDQWMQEHLLSAFPDKSIDDISVQDWVELFQKEEQELSSRSPRDWTFAGLERGSDGSFDDVELADLVKSCIEEPAHSFGARSIPAALKYIEILRQMQSRNVFQVCTFNEFRKYLNLKPLGSFQEWNSDPEIAAAAEQLYTHIDNLELYPGLVAEDIKPPMPGSGLCPGQTIGRGILDDAVSLIRSDRFLTYDFNISTLTSWGMSQLQSQGGAYGGILSTLLFRALPGAWFFNSTYSLLPFYTPEDAKQILKDNGVLDQYSAERPDSDMAVRAVCTYEACKQVLNDREVFRVLYGHNILEVSHGAGFMIMYDDNSRHDALKTLIYGPFFTDNFEADIKRFFATQTKAAIEQSSITIKRGGRRQLDVVRDVANVVPILWLAQKYSIPIKSQHNQRGLISPAELLGALMALFVYTSFPMVESANWVLRDAASQASAAICAILEARLKVFGGFNFVEKLTDWLAGGTAFEVSQDAEKLYHGLLASKRPHPELVAAMLGTMIPIAGNLTQQTSLLVDLYLQPQYKEHKNRIVELAHREDEAAFHELEGYVYEGMRLQPVIIGVPRQANKDVTIRDGDRNVFVKAGNRLVVGLGPAHTDPAVFPEPEKLDPHRPREQYLLLGAGMHFCFGARLISPAIASMLKEIFKLPGLRRAKGRAGQFVRVQQEVAEGLTASLFLDTFSRETPLPTSLRVEYDAATPLATKLARGI